MSNEKPLEETTFFLVRTSQSLYYLKGTGIYSGHPKLYTEVGAKRECKKRNSFQSWNAQPGDIWEVVPARLVLGEPLES